MAKVVANKKQKTVVGTGNDVLVQAFWHSNL